MTVKIDFKNCFLWLLGGIFAVTNHSFPFNLLKGHKNSYLSKYKSKKAIYDLLYLL